jgi:hypothetical protein
MVLPFSSLALTRVSRTFKATILFHPAKQPNLCWQVDILFKDTVGGFRSLPFIVSKLPVFPKLPLPFIHQGGLAWFSVVVMLMGGLDVYNNPPSLLFVFSNGRTDFATRPDLRDRQRRASCLIVQSCC